ncbi:MAG: hypothetical protein JJE05_05655 [Actinobacteria bacterium]|nr:hypothetical protein [Actinomycetota bacterium]
MTTGPRMRAAVPPNFDQLPYLSSPLLNGRSGRSFDFVPTEKDDGPGEDSFWKDKLEDRDGRTVEVYERPDDPILWWLRWLLPSGAIYTHLREEDGFGFVQPTVAAVSIVLADNGLPFILADPPLKVGASTSPGNQELISFVSSSLGEGWSITFQRPSFVTKGDFVEIPRREPGDPAVFRAGADLGVEIQVFSGQDPDAGREIARQAVETLDEDR